MTNSLEFRKNGKLRILQVSDPQDLKFVRKAMVEMLDKAYDSLNPDLVLFTGDNILGNHLLDARIGSRQVAEGKDATFKVMKESLDLILDPVDRRGIPFAMIYGNHDDMNPVSKDEQIEIYRSYSMCMPLNKDNPDVDCDTYVITLCDNGKPDFALYMLDSAWQDMDENHKCHEDVTPETVKWFRETNGKLKEENGGKPVPSMIFLHIPVPETMELLEECSSTEMNALKMSDGKYMKLNPLKAHGILGEPPSVLKNDNGLFEAAKEVGGVKAIVTGHDHRNCFVGTLDGIKLIQTGCASFRCYGSSAARGVRVIDIDKDGSYETKFYTYFDICGTSVASKLKYFRDSDENEVKKFTILGVSAIAMTASTIAKIIKKKIR